MKIIFINSFNPSYWDNVKSLVGADVFHICPPREKLKDETLSQELFNQKQDTLLLEFILKNKLTSSDVILVEDHLKFNFKYWSSKTDAKLVGLVYKPDYKNKKKKFKYLIYKYEFPDFNRTEIYQGRRNRTIPLLEIPEPNYLVKRDRIAFLYNEEHDPEQHVFTKYIMEECLTYEYVFLNQYLNDEKRLRDELASVKLVVNCSQHSGYPNFQHYVTALGCGCLIMMPEHWRYARILSHKWIYSNLYIGIGKPTKKTKKWLNKVNQLRLRPKLIMWVKGLVDGYCFRQYEARKEYNKLKNLAYLSDEEFIKKLICL